MLEKNIKKENVPLISNYRDTGALLGAYVSLLELAYIGMTQDVDGINTIREFSDSLITKTGSGYVIGASLDASKKFINYFKNKLLGDYKNNHL